MFTQKNTFVSALGAALCLLILLAGCSTPNKVLQDTLPESTVSGIQRVDSPEGIDLEFIPDASAGDITMNIKGMDYTLNQVFKGMTAQMLQAKFDTLRDDSPNHLTVTLDYVYMQQESRRQSRNQVDMGVIVELKREGQETKTKELNFSTGRNLEGYSVRSGQLQNLLVKFIESIDQFLNESFGVAVPSASTEGSG